MNKTYVHILSAFLLLFMVVGCLRDKGNIAGTVMDDQNNPLSNADVAAINFTVYLQLDISGCTSIEEVQAVVDSAGETMYTAKSESDGSYNLYDVGTGEYFIMALHNFKVGSSIVPVIGGVMGCASSTATVDLKLS